VYRAFREASYLLRLAEGKPIEIPIVTSSGAHPELIWQDGGEWFFDAHDVGVATNEALLECVLSHFGHTHASAAQAACRQEWPTNIPLFGQDLLSPERKKIAQ
jgi:hypothetical protein